MTNDTMRVEPQCKVHDMISRNPPIPSFVLPKHHSNGRHLSGPLVQFVCVVKHITSTMPPVRTGSNTKPVKYERTHEENQERLVGCFYSGNTMG